MVIENRTAPRTPIDRFDMMAQRVEILLIEDNRCDEELTRFALRDHPLSNAIRVARDGAEALELLFDPNRAAAKACNPDVILLCLRLRKVDGPAVMQRIRSESRTRNVPVFILISSDYERDIAERQGLEPNGYIVKPLDIDSFASAMRSAGL